MFKHGTKVKLRLFDSAHTSRFRRGFERPGRCIADGEVLNNWIRTLDEARALDVMNFVPGHGDLMTLRDVTALHASMLRFYSGVKEGFENGLSEVEIRKSLDLSVWQTLERAYVIGRNINRAYLEIEWESFNK